MSKGQDALRERPATGHGQPRATTEDIATPSKRQRVTTVFATLTRRIAGDLPALVQDPLGIFTAKSMVPGGVAPLALGLKRGFLIGDLALLRQVLLDNAANYDKRTPSFDAVRVVLGNGLLTSGGAFWERQRRIAQPTFHGEKVRRFGPILCRMASDCVDRWERVATALVSHPFQPGPAARTARAQ